MEEGFRIRFANGETIDFYADSREQKEGWMAALSQVVGKPAVEKAQATRWTDLVLARERAADTAQAPAAAAAGAAAERSAEPKRSDSGNSTSSTARKPLPKSAPVSPLKGPPTSRPPPLPAVEGQRSRTPPMEKRTGHRSREAVKSMIF